jgi:hypothetical protein
LSGRNDSADDQNRFERLTKQWGKMDALWKKASQRSQEMIAGYRWAIGDDRTVWNRVLAARMREAIAFKKAASARQTLVDFVRTPPDPGD